MQKRSEIVGDRERGSLGDIERAAQLAVDLSLESGNRLLCCQAGLLQLPCQPLDRIALAPGMGLVRVLVVLLIACMMAAIPVGGAYRWRARRRREPQAHPCRPPPPME